MDQELSDRWHAREQALVALLRLRGSDAGLDQAMASVLAVGMRTLGVERAGVWVVDRDRRELRCILLRDRQGSAGAPLPRIPITDLGAYEQAMVARRAIAIGQSDSAAGVERLDEAYFRPTGIVATLDAPMYRDGRVVGVVCHESRTPRTWTDDEAELVVNLADTVSNLLLSAEVHRAEEQLRIQEARMYELLAADALARVASGVAHDLNNLLLVMLVNAETLAERADRGVSKPAAAIASAAEAAAKLVRELTAFAIRDPDRQVLALDATLAGTLDELAEAAGVDRSFTAELRAPDARIAASPGRLRQALANLVTNAREATVLGGRITLRTAIEAHPEERAGVYARVTVEDDGTGMDEATRAACLQPYFSTRGGPGRGLGLAIVQAVAVSHDGFVAVSSAPGKGARISLYLPLVPG